MCHPGDKSDYFDSFNQSDERVQEKDYLLNGLDDLMRQIKDLYKCGSVELVNFNALKPKCENKETINVLLYGKLTLGTGNHITMMRYKDLLQG
jgi:hypothetical protein